MRSIYWGLIGIGDVCRFKSGPAFAKVPHSHIAAVCRRTAAKAEAFAREHDVPRWYTTARELVADAQVNAVYVATPPDTHLELALLAAAVGKPCLVEKPLARNTGEAAAIVGAFERARVPLYTALYRRAMPRYVAARELLARLGRVSCVRATVCRNKPDDGWRCDRRVAGGGYVVDVGSHVVDIIDFLLGPMMVITSDAGRKMDDDDERIVQTTRVEEAENFASFHFSLPLHDASGTFVMDFAYAGETVDELRITGENGTLRFAALGIYGSSPNVVLEDPDGKVLVEMTPESPQHAHQPLITQIVDDLRNGTAECTATGGAGLRAAVVIDAALERSSAWPRLALGSYMGEEKVKEKE